MPIVPLNGTELFYLTVGQGTPCLIMHGGLGFDHAVPQPGQCFHHLGIHIQDRHGLGQGSGYFSLQMEHDFLSGLLTDTGYPREDVHLFAQHRPADCIYRKRGKDRQPGRFNSTG